MRRWNLLAEPHEAGRASLEFLTAAIVLLIPVLFLGLSLSSVLSAALATDQAARHAARVFVQETSVATASARAEQTVRVTLANYGIDSLEVLERTCSPASCLAPGALVTIRVGVQAPLFSSDFLPGFLGRASVLVEGSARSMVSRYGGTP